MQAVLCKQHGGPETLVTEEVPELHAKPGEVVVSVHAAAVNFPDTLIIQNKYQFKPELPFSPGGEVAGVVKEVGQGVTGFARGDKVIAVCGWGGFAEEVATPAAKLTHIRSGVSMEAAASLVITYGTTQYALQACAIAAGRDPARARSCRRHRPVCGGTGQADGRPCDRGGVVG
jgi:NADPH:quinone reductase